MSVELPKDAEGREIPLDTVVLFRDDGHAYNIVRWSFITDFETGNAFANSWRAISENGVNLIPESMYLTMPDSWEQLEKDLGECIEKDEICCYYNKGKDCLSCPISGNNPNGCISEVFKAIKERIRNLRGED